MVCIQILVKRKISRERSVRNGLSTSNTAHHLQVDLLHTLSSILGFQPRARVLGGNSAVVDQRNLLTQLLGLFEVVRRQEYRQPPAIQLSNVLPQGIPQLYVDPRRRFVEEQYLGVVHEGAGEHDP